ncbi:MAG: tRNA (cytidine(34)-2'-O)-methyltransferase [Alphaproteobacteria bacterium]|nr:tRNA (cytidine(34)-2'-O)-methyltransferase [Alphaproteobacteria bacterium]
MATNFIKPSHIGVALYEPDIPQNVGSVMRLCACLGAPLHIVEPCGFPWDDKRLKRVAMDYAAQVRLQRHRAWEEFRASAGRLVLFSTRAETPYTAFAYRPGDILLFGRESAGVPEHVHEAAHARVTIPLHPATRSLNVALAAAMGLGEALRQQSGEP